MNFCRYKAVQQLISIFEDCFMKRSVVALLLVLASSGMVSVSRANIAAPFPTPHTAHYLPAPWSSGARPRPAANPSSSASASETSPGLINSGLAMAAITTTSLIGVIVLRKRHDEL
jgi:hypothetical protein